jgi:hypothetical protein
MADFTSTRKPDKYDVHCVDVQNQSVSVGPHTMEALEKPLNSVIAAKAGSQEKHAKP